jgi:hypothetical protein
VTNSNVHFHVVFLEGVYLDRTEAALKPRFIKVEPPRSLSTKQAVGLVRPELPYGRCQAIIPFSAYDASMTQPFGERG